MSKAINRAARIEDKQWGDARKLADGEKRSFAFVNCAEPTQFYVKGQGDVEWTVTLAVDRNVIARERVTAATMRTGFTAIGQSIRVEGTARGTTDAACVVTPLVVATQER